MKERLALVLSWYAFAHVALIAISYVFEQVLHLRRGDWGLFGDALYSYFRFYERTLDMPFQLILVVSPAIWVGLWITTGKSRFLPWKG